MFTTSFENLFSINFMWDHPVKLSEKVTKLSVDSEGTVIAYVGDKSYTLARKGGVVHWNDPRNGPMETSSPELYLTAAERQSIPVERDHV